ncbi:MAG: CoA pyrophosphatase, partial [Leptospiraceae bacterium]|nr:CoA pyrophosphatase [Leptospiraceae bacterium]
MKVNLQKIIDRFREGYKDPYPELPAKNSAVVIPLYETDEGYGVILTKRSEKLKSHPGQISFPGGVYSEEDKDYIDTAYREWEEELGISSKSLKLIAPYKPVHTFTGYIIHPIVSLYEGDFKFDHSTHEVDKVILLDLEDFINLPFYTIQNPRFPSS